METPHNTVSPGIQNEKDFSVQAWLKSFDMEIYTPNFIQNCFNKLQLCSNLTVDDIRSMGIIVSGHIKEILNQSRILKAKYFDVREWLQSIHMEMYTPLFIDNEYKYLMGCANLKEMDLRNMGITIKGHIKEILAQSHKLHNPPPIDEVIRDRKQLSNSYHARAKLSTPVTRKKNIEYLLVRHGESEANVDKSLFLTLADHAVKLSAKGEEQAREAGRRIKEFFEEKYLYRDPQRSPDWKCCIWTSTYKRARQTAHLIKQEAGNWITDIKENICLVEQQYGLFEGENWSNGSIDHIFPRELSFYNKCAKFGGRFWATVPMGESRFDVCKRVYHTLQLIQEDGFDHTIIVSHGVTLRSFVMCFYNKTPEWFEEEPNPPNGSIKLISQYEERYIWPEEDERGVSERRDADTQLLRDSYFIPPIQQNEL